MSEVAVKCVHEAYTFPEKLDALLSTAIHGLSSRTVVGFSVVFTAWHPDCMKVGPEATVATHTYKPSLVTLKALFTCQTCPSAVAGKPPERGTKFSVQLVPPFLETANLLLLNPPFREKSLIIATRLLTFRGLTAMCSSASGTDVVGVTVG